MIAMGGGGVMMIVTGLIKMPLHGVEKAFPVAMVTVSILQWKGQNLRCVYLTNSIV